MPVDPKFAAAVKKEHARIQPLLRALDDKPQFFAFVPHAKSAEPDAKLSEPAPLLLHSKMSPLPIGKVLNHAKQLKLDIQAPALVYAGTVQRSKKGLVFVLDKAASKGAVTPAAGQKLLKTLLKQLPELKTAIIVADSWSADAEEKARGEMEREEPNEAAAAEAEEAEAEQDDGGVDEPGVDEAGGKPSDEAAIRYHALAGGLPKDLEAAGALPVDDKRTIAKLVAQAKALADAGSFEKAADVLDKLKAWLTSRARAADAGAARVATGPSLAAYSKSRLIWVAAQKQARSELKKLVDAVLNDPETTADPDFEAIQTRMEGLGKALDRYGAELVDVMDEVTNARTEDQKRAAITKTVKVLSRYRQSLDRDKVLREVDENPYENVGVYATLKKSLDGIGTLLGA
ncbi:MAG: hypothetical protein V4850_25690 [Myxococcota bacterium]